MNTYKIILDEEKLVEFINWLPDTLSNETYYICLFARKKYCSQVAKINSGKAQLKKVLSDKSRMISKIKQLECKLDAYVDKNGNAVPQDALAIYITPNPRDLQKAIQKTCQDMVVMLSNPYHGSNPVSISMSNVQRSRGTSKYMVFDFDIPKDVFDAKLAMQYPSEYYKKIDYIVEVVKKVTEYFPLDILTIIETRGGVHILVDTKLAKEIRKDWYNCITKIEGLDPCGTQMTPIVGCFQGGFTPRFMDKDLFK